MNRLIELSRVGDFEGVLDRVLESSQIPGLKWYLREVLLSKDSPEREDIRTLLNPATGLNNEARAFKLTLAHVAAAFFEQGVVDSRDERVRHLYSSLSRKTNYYAPPSDGDYRQYVRAQARDAILYRLQSEYVRGTLHERAGVAPKSSRTSEGMDSKDESRRDFYQWAAEVADYYRVTSVLAICVGDGEEFERAFVGSGITVVGCDTSEAIDLHRQRGTSGDWRDVPRGNVPFSLGRSFDLILCRDVLRGGDVSDAYIKSIRLHAHSRTLCLVGTAIPIDASGTDSEARTTQPPGEDFEHQMDRLGIFPREYSRTSRGTVPMHTVFGRPRAYFTPEPEISFLMVVTERDLSIAEFAVRSYALLAGISFKLFVYANCLPQSERERIAREWSNYPWVEIIVPPYPGMNSENPNKKFGFGVEGPYERCEVPWDVELPKLPGSFVAMVDADFEILHPSFVERTLAMMRSNSGITVSSVSITPTAQHDPTLMYMSRLNTWYLVFSRKAFEFNLSNLPCNQSSTDERIGLLWDSAGLRQQILKDVFEQKSYVLEPEFEDCFIHYGAFSKYRGMEGTTVGLYRLLRILIKIGGAETVHHRGYARYVHEFEVWAKSVNFTIPYELDLRVVATALFDHLFKEIQSTNPYKNASNR